EPLLPRCALPAGVPILVCVDAALAHDVALSLHDALPICFCSRGRRRISSCGVSSKRAAALSLTVIVSSFFAASTLARRRTRRSRSEEHTSELQSLRHLVCRLLLQKKNNRCKP